MAITLNKITLQIPSNVDAISRNNWMKVQEAVNRMLDSYIGMANIVESSGLGKLKISSDDATYNYLQNKLVAGSNITLTVINPGSSETYSIASTATGTGGSVLEVQIFS